MKPHASLPLLGMLALGLAWGAPPAAAQSFNINLGDLLSGRGGINIAPTPGNPYADPYMADRPAYPYGRQGYGQPYGYGPQGYRPPALPEEPPFGGYPPRAGYGPPTYRDAYRPPFPGPGGFTGYGPGPRPPAFGNLQQLVPLADTLVGQVGEFLQAFTPSAGVVPEGREFLADAQALGDAAGRFRQLLASGVTPAQLSQELRAVEGTWLRLQQRTDRVSMGRTGPNIQQIGMMGSTIQQMRQFLP